MGIEYFLKLYWRNAQSMWNNGFKFADWAEEEQQSPRLALGLRVAHVIASPITAGILSFAKTCFDFFTRDQPVIKEAIASQQVIMDRMNSGESSQLVQDICSYSAKSNSSRELQENLRNEKNIGTQLQWIKAYMNDEKNQGKKMFQVIMGTFKPPVDAKPVQEAEEVQLGSKSSGLF